MIKYIRREFIRLFLSLIVIICIYNSVNLTFFNEKSVTKIFEMNENILLLNQELLDLKQIEEKLMTKINFLSFESLNEDYVSELAQKTLGMIKEDNVLVILDE
ncbi:septum formation initiator family protein [Alphaproteobacteria bacterium]|nr:septum formation initiator family protein [Alphaproteobacteria bacterium]